MQKGHYYEEFEEGQEFISPARTVTEADVVFFAGFSGDFNPLHTDEEFSRRSIFGTRIAHGVIGIAFATGFQSRLGLVDGTGMAFLGINNWRFLRAVKPGDTVQLVTKVTEKRESRKNPEGGVVIFHLELANQNKEVVQEGSWAILVKKRKSC